MKNRMTIGSAIQLYRIIPRHRETEYCLVDDIQNCENTILIYVYVIIYDARLMFFFCGVQVE